MKGRSRSNSSGRDGGKPNRNSRGGDKPYGKRLGGGKGRGKSDDYSTHKKFLKPKFKGAEDLVPNSDEMRLNRFLAIAGVASRRESDDLIKMGLVTVNGKIVTEMGHKVKITDDVRYNGTKIHAEKKVYIVMNKPKGFLTTVDDPKARKTVMDLIGGAVTERIYPVGRLDRATTGVLMFTNDGDLAKKLTHPSHGAQKIYHAVLDKKLTKGDMEKIAAGLELEDGPAKVDAISFIDEKSKTNVGLEIHMGKNRIVRRIFAHLGYEVTKLDRTTFAGLNKKNLKRGQWRFLSTREVEFLRTR